MWHEVCVERTPQVFAKFDPSRGLALDAYFIRIMLWYAYKHVAGHGREKHRKRLSRPLPDQDTALSHEETLSWTDLLEPLAQEHGEQGEFDAWLIMQVAVYGYSFSELAGSKALPNETPGRVSRMYRDAIERARMLLGRELDEQ